MNNLKNLYPCLESIRKYTTVSYETLVVAYLFTKEKLEKVKRDYSWVTFIESNEIRGFSENNNLALRQAKGRYCFVLNDDTILREGCIDKLVDAFCKLPDNVAIVSPNVFDGNGKLTVSGNPPFNVFSPLIYFFRIKNRYRGNKWVMGNGLFKTYNILGAAFLIKRDIFEKVGWFDEYYFFAPEDIALSTLLNKKGYECWVNTEAELVHLEGMTGGNSFSMIKTATAAAGCKGSIYFYSENKLHLYLLSVIIHFSILSVRYCYHLIRSISKTRPNKHYILSISIRNQLASLFCRKTPKELFVYYYNKLPK